MVDKFMMLSSCKHW